MNIVADKAIPFVQKLFAPIGNVTLVNGREIDTACLRNADVLIVRTITRVNAGLLQGSPVKFVASATSGFDHIDVAYLEAQGITFAYAPGCNARSVAEYVLSSLLVLAEQFGIDLQHSQAGIIGHGNVGSIVSEFLHALEINCVINDPILKAAGNGNYYSELDEVLAADIISLHVPLAAGGRYPTWHMINAGFLNRLRDEVILINTSRGSVCDETALIRFMDGNKNAHVVLDVWENEPSINHALLSRTAINTPHIAGYSMDSKLRGTEMVFQQVCNYFEISDKQACIAVLPEPDNTEIMISQFDDDLEAVQMAVLASYDVRSDSASLRRVLEIKEGDRSVYFDQLRNNYPLRREFSAMTIRIPDGSDSLKEKLSTLGFNVRFDK